MSNLEVTSFSHERISVYNFSDDFIDEGSTEQLFESNRGVKYRDATQIVVPSGEYWVFDYGVIVFWGVDEDERQFLLNRLTDGDKEVVDEHFRFIFSDHLKISQDFITLPDQEPLTRLSISHALAQSVKLQEYERTAQDSIVTYSPIGQELATKGKITLSRKNIAQIRGHLFNTKSAIILHYGLLDTPDFFWEYPEYEETYNTMARYLEVHQRVELLSKKLATIHEMFEMLADEQKHHHSSFLEWIIIILISIEIVFYLFEEIPRWFS